MASSTRSYFWQGVRDGAPFALVVGPFGMLFGVVATEAGLNVIQALSFSATVSAGAAQFTALQLLSENTMAVIALLSALVINLRMVMYSASITPWIGELPFWKRAVVAYFLVDQTYAVSIMKFEAEPTLSKAERFAYFIGVVVPICPLWYLSTLLGAVIGNATPDWLALDFAIPITFLALVAPMLRTVAHIAAAVTAIILALVFVGLPYNAGLFVAGLGGMMVGAQIELIQSRRSGET